MVGAVFLSEGLQKFLYPVLRGPGRFADMGWPVPEGVASLVGGVEVVCGLLILIGFYTRLAAAGTATIMTTAIITTKIPIWLGEGFGPFEVRTLGEYGFMEHGARDAHRLGDAARLARAGDRRRRAVGHRFDVDDTAPPLGVLLADFDPTCRRPRPLPRST